MSLERRLAAMRRLFTAWGHGTDLARVQVYAEALADLPAEQLDAAVAARIRSSDSRFVPTVAELRLCVAEQRTSLPPVDLAWSEVLRAVSRYGRDRVPQWSAPEVEQAVAAIGWRAICNSDETGLSIARQQFTKAYGSTRRRRIEGEQVGVLSGQLAAAFGSVKRLGGGE